MRREASCCHLGKLSESESASGDEAGPVCVDPSNAYLAHVVGLFVYIDADGALHQGPRGGQ